MIKIFEEDLTFGQKRELYFKTFVNKIFDKTDGRDGDFIHIKNKKKLELKSEEYNLVPNLEKVDFQNKITPNLFIETLSVYHQGKIGGPEQALKKNCFWYAHFFENNIFVLFKTEKIVEWFKKNKEKYRKILIPNEGYKTEGCPIPYKDLENICLKKIKLQKGEDYSDLFSK